VNKKTLKLALLLMMLIILVACYAQDENGTPPPTRIPKLKIEVHGATYLCNRYKLYEGGNLYLYGCQGFGGARVVIDDVKDFRVTPYKLPRG